MSKKDTALFPQTKRFADQLQGMLNQTVCDNARVDGRIYPDGHQSVVGTNLEDFTSNPVRLRTAASTPLWLDVVAYLMLDQAEGAFLTVRSSVCALLVGDDEQEVLHYDYEREKEQYAEAHLQIQARHTRFDQFLAELGRKEVDALAKIHLPVGGRRFRPALEDLLECLIQERIVEPRPGWKSVLDESRQKYRDRQIAAAIRRQPEIAIGELRRLGYGVTDEATFLARARQLFASPSSLRPNSTKERPRSRRT